MWLTVATLAHKVLKSRNVDSTIDSTPKNPRSRSAVLRIVALLPILILSIALLLSILCLSGGKPGMEDKFVFELNTSRIGENLRQELDSKITSLEFRKRADIISTVTAAVPAITMAPRGIGSDISSLESHATSAIAGVNSAVQSDVSSVQSAVASRVSSAVSAAETNFVNVMNRAYDGLITSLNLSDFYTIGISGSCSGRYVFQNGTNVTVGESGLPTAHGKSSVQKHIDSCTPHSSIDPMSMIRILYWIGIVFIAVALILGLITLVLSPSRKLALINILSAVPAFCIVGLASAVTHGVSLGAARLVNFIGEDIGVAGYVGNRFLAMTWSCTVLLLLNIILWAIMFALAERGQLSNGYSTGKAQDIEMETVAQQPVIAPQ